MRGRRRCAFTPQRCASAARSAYATSTTRTTKPGAHAYAGASLGARASTDNWLRSGDDWEEMHGEEAEEALAQLATRGGAHAQQRGEQPAEVGGAEADAGADAHMQEMEEEEAGDAPYVALADNGVELVRACRRAPRPGAY